MSAFTKSWPGVIRTSGMRAAIAAVLLSITFAIECTPMMADENHRIPMNRTELKGGEWFPFILSKIAPLEWWTYQESISDVKREEYSTDWGYQLARQNTSEFPRFCFSMFRPSEASYGALLNAVKDYEGAVAWVMHDDCIVAWKAKPTGHGMVRLPYAMSEQEIEKHNQSLRQPPDPAFVDKAVADIPLFCSYLEKRLGLTEHESQQFDPRWLTAKGLAESKGEFEDFMDPGIWSVFLARDPQAYAKTFQPTSPADRDLGMGIGMFQSEELLKELGAERNQVKDGTGEGSLSVFPLLSRLSDYTDDVIYEPGEVAPFLTELFRAQQIVKERRSIRGLDNLIRIARWAEKLNVGIYFGGV